MWKKKLTGSMNNLSLKNFFIAKMIPHKSSLFFRNHLSFFNSYCQTFIFTTVHFYNNIDWIEVQLAYKKCGLTEIHFDDILEIIEIITFHIFVILLRQTRFEKNHSRLTEATILLNIFLWLRQIRVPCYKSRLSKYACAQDVTWLV